MKDIIELYFNDPDMLVIRSDYENIKNSYMEIGFRSEKINGKDVHKINRDIVISIQRFHEGVITNLVFSNGQAFRLELLDNEIIPYYSDYIEIRYIISGHLVLDVEGQKAVFKEGDVCFIHSKAYHHEIVSESDCIFFNIGIERELFNDAFLSSVSSSPFKQFLRTNILKIGQKENFLQFIPEQKQSEEIKRYFYTIFNEVQRQRIGYLDISKGYIIRLIDHLASNYNYHFSEKESELYYKNLFDTITQYMDDHLANVSMEDLASEFHFHPNYFNNLIKKNAGMTYSAYLIQLRMNKAKKLLETTDFSIDEIAWLVGYHNKGFFYKCFTNDVGMSPKQYRKKLSENK